MKAIACGECADIRALPNTPPLQEHVSCRCGNVEAWWVNPSAGTVKVRARVRASAFILGLNNQLLVPALRGELGMHEDFRRAHDEATDAPNHVFDKSRCGCWAVIFAVGRTNDVSWADDDEGIEVIETEVSWPG